MKTLELNGTHAGHQVSELLGHIKKKVQGMHRGSEMASRVKDKAGHRVNYVSPLMDMNLPSFEILCVYAMQSAGVEESRRSVILSEEVMQDLGSLTTSDCGQYFGQLLIQLRSDLQRPGAASSKYINARSDSKEMTGTQVQVKAEVSSSENLGRVAKGLKADCVGGDIISSEPKLGPSRLDGIYT